MVEWSSFGVVLSLSHFQVDLNFKGGFVQWYSQIGLYFSNATMFLNGWIQTIDGFQDLFVCVKKVRLRQDYGDAVVAWSYSLNAFGRTLPVIAITFIGRILLGRREHVVLEFVVVRPESLGGDGFLHELQLDGSAKGLPE